MIESVFSTLINYFKGLLTGLRSILSSSWSAVPYLFAVGENVKEVTEQYPDPVSSRTEDDLPARTRGLLFNDIDRCTGCGDCTDVCPVDCIELVTEQGLDQSKKWVSVFNIDFGRCIFCGLCVDVCEPGSLVHSKQFEGAVYELKDLVTGFGRGRVTEEQRRHWERVRKIEDRV